MLGRLYTLGKHLFYKFSDYAWDECFEKYILQTIRYRTIKFHSMYRTRRGAQYTRTAFLGIIGGTIGANICEIENKQNLFQTLIFYGQYSKLVFDIRIDNNYLDCYKVATDIIQKGKKMSLTSLEILSLSQLINKPEINLHAEYIASLK